MSFALFSSEVDDEGFPTKTTELLSNKNYCNKTFQIKSQEFSFFDHEKYITDTIQVNSSKMKEMESNITSMAHYVSVPLTILGLDRMEKYSDVKQKIVAFLAERTCKNGGFSGFPNDFPNLVINLLTITALAICDCEETYKIIDREGIYKMLADLKNEDGSYNDSFEGGPDLRSTYAALAIASMLDILTPEITHKTVEFTKRCFNYDGGFGPLPNCESHCGYVHCGIGILYILEALDEIDLNKVVKYIAMRQDPFSGGFNGRVNKLVDSCYTWWIGTSSQIISKHLGIAPFWNVECVTEYILKCSQLLNGGFRDSPPSDADFFHTCYALAGLCICGNTSIIGDNVPELDLIVPAPKEKISALRKYFKNADVHEFS